jgi:hypothetical protein
MTNKTDLCFNNGTCSNEPGGYSCQCEDYYLGSHCERKHICLEHSPCLNHGQCRPEGEHFYCECSSNFTGKSKNHWKDYNKIFFFFLFEGLHCEFSTCESIPCHNNGTCIPDSERGFLCNCTDTGK